MARIYPWNETAQKHYVSIKNILDKDPISTHTLIANEIGVSKQRVGQIIATINREAVLNGNIEPIVLIRPPRPNKGRPRKRNPGFQGGNCTNCGKFLACTKGNKKKYENSTKLCRDCFWELIRNCPVCKDKLCRDCKDKLFPVLESEKRNSLRYNNCPEEKFP